MAAVIATAATVAACGQRDRDGLRSAQVIARVNGQDITVYPLPTESGFPGASNGSTDVLPSREALEGLIDEQLLVNMGKKQNLDRDPQVKLAIEKARRQIIVDRVQEKLAASMTQPAVEEIRAFYDANPALFAKHRIYIFRQFSIDRSAFDGVLRGRLDTVKTREDVIAALAAQDIPYTEAAVVRPAEQLPMPMVPVAAAMRRGKVVVINGQRETNILQLMHFIEQPTSFEQASPAIREYLVNVRRKELVADQLRTMRAGSDIEYLKPTVESTARMIDPGDDATSSVQASQAPLPAQQATKAVAANGVAGPAGTRNPASTKIEKRSSGTLQTAERAVGEYLGQGSIGREN